LLAKKDKETVAVSNFTHPVDTVIHWLFGVQACSFAVTASSLSAQEVSLNSRSENVAGEPVVVSELKHGRVQRQIFRE
jgi:hypothetical protein